MIIPLEKGNSQDLIVLVFCPEYYVHASPALPKFFFSFQSFIANHGGEVAGGKGGEGCKYSKKFKHVI